MYASIAVTERLTEELSEMLLYLCFDDICLNITFQVDGVLIKFKILDWNYLITNFWEYYDLK